MSHQLGTTLQSGLTADDDLAVPAKDGLRLMGWQAQEAAGSPAVASFVIHHGEIADESDAVVPVTLAAGASGGRWYGNHGVSMKDGISIEHVAGEVDVYRTL